MSSPHTLTKQCWCRPTLVLTHVGAFTVIGLKHNDEAPMPEFTEESLPTTFGALHTDPFDP